MYLIKRSKFKGACKMKDKRQSTLTAGLFILYLIILTWIIVFKLTLNISQLDHLRNINLIPFSSSAIVNGKIAINEILYNILVFIPVGIYINMLKLDWSFAKKIAPCFFISLTFEVLQFIFAIGASDITDLIGNTLGGIVGIGIFYVAQKIFNNKAVKIINTVALVGTVAVVTLLVLLVVINR